ERDGHRAPRHLHRRRLRGAIEDWVDVRHDVRADVEEAALVLAEDEAVAGEVARDAQVRPQLGAASREVSRGTRVYMFVGFRHELPPTGHPAASSLLPPRISS